MNALQIRKPTGNTNIKLLDVHAVIYTKKWTP